MAAEGRLDIRGADIHLWAAMRGDLADDAALIDTFDAAERRRAAALRHDRDRALFVLAHAVLRDVLSRYTAVAARDLAFESGPHGRPTLAAQHGTALDFSLSHSGDAVLVAVAQARRVGVDIEKVVAHDDLQTVAAQVFSEEECGALADLAGADRVALFHALWTRREACVKAWGNGLSASPRQISLLNPVAGGILYPGASTLDRLSCCNIDPPQGYAAAVAVSGEFGSIIGRRWRAPRTTAA